MASLKDSIEAASNLQGYTPVTPASSVPAPDANQQPDFTGYMRCPLPLQGADPDRLRQFYQGSKVPQARLLPLIKSNVQSGTATSKVLVTSSTGTGGSSTAVTVLKATTATLVSGVLNPGDQFLGTLAISRSFQLLSVTATVACRIQLYGTRSAQTGDSGRGLDVAPTPGTQQNLITDLVLDTLPYQWSFQNRCGSNQDTPQGQTAYLTVTNLSPGSTAVKVTLAYCPLET